MPGIELYDYQLDAVKRMKNGCILCGGVGSGKSRTALAYYYIEQGGEVNTPEYVPMGDPPKDLYIITTARKRDTLEWEKEMSPFLMSCNPGVSLYSNSITIDSWNNIKKYENIKNAFFIFDEQRVVGSGSWSKAFIKIAKVNDWILLSATPGDTWQDYIPVFVANGFYKNRSEFKREHIVYAYAPNCNYPKIDRYINTGRLIRLRNRILVDMDFKRDTVSHHEDIILPYDRTAYRTITKDRWNIWENEPIENASQYCYALRRVVNADDSRQVAVLELLEKHPRIIIFYNFDYEREILKNLYYGDDVSVAEWNGYKHQEIPDTERWVYLVQYNAGAEGWNCIKTDTIIFYSQSYSYKMMEQASGRINRLNTPFQDLYYYHLKSKAPIDIAISRCLKAKREFNQMEFMRSNDK